MYLSIDKSDSVKKEDVVGIFDMDTATFSAVSRAFLKKAEKEKRVDSKSLELPKSFVLVCPKAQKKPDTKQKATQKASKTQAHSLFFCLY